MITIIAAVAREGAIGANGGIPWRAPEDMAFFKATTMGHAVVMGRRTYESIGRPLKNRWNYVLTEDPVGFLHRERAKTFALNEVMTFLFVCPDLPAALDSAQHPAIATHAGADIFIIGGAQVYAEALPLADRLLITEVDVEVLGADAFFPSGHLFAPQNDPLVSGAGWACTGSVVCPGGWPGPEFRETSRRRGTDPRLTFVEWRRVTA